MKTRVLTGLIIAIIYVAVLLLTIYVQNIFFDIFAVLLMIVAGLEMSKAIGKKFSKPNDILIVLTAIIGYTVFSLTNNLIDRDFGGLTIFFAVILIMCIVSIIFTMFSKANTINNVFSTLLVLIYPITLLVYFLGLNYLSTPSFPSLNIAAIVLLVLVSSFTDTFAFLIGVTFKGKKLCPSISPKKTVSGAIGGLMGGLLGGSLVLMLSALEWLKIPALSNTGAMNIVHYLTIGLVGSMFVQLGDLLASYTKRQCGIKDFGNILPGHGGILDRIDGMILLSLFIYIYMTILVL